MQKPVSFLLPTRFMWQYTTWQQLLRCGAFGYLMNACGAPMANVCLYLTAAPILAAFRLFYWGTYEPHKPPKGDARLEMGWEKSRTASVRLQGSVNH